MVTNVAGFKRHFELFPRVVVEAGRDEMVRQADLLVADLKANAPVYTGTETHRRPYKGNKGSTLIVKGALRDSIGWTWGKVPKGAIEIASSASEYNGARIRVYAGGNRNGVDAFYARWVEHGTSQWAGNPFFFFTYRGKRQKMKSAITRSITRAIRSHYGVPSLPRKPRV